MPDDGKLLLENSIDILNDVVLIFKDELTGIASNSEGLLELPPIMVNPKFVAAETNVKSAVTKKVEYLEISFNPVLSIVPCAKLVNVNDAIMVEAFLLPLLKSI